MASRTLTARDKEKILRRIEEAKKRIAHERDVLRDLMSGVIEIADSADYAVEALETAIDKLSEYL